MLEQQPLDLPWLDPEAADLHLAVGAAQELKVAIGQQTYEEINIVPTNAPGVNYGWNRMEGMHCYPPAVATCALAGVGVVRSADWLFVLCLLTAWVVGSLALAGGRTWTGIVTVSVAVTAAVMPIRVISVRIY